MILFLFLQIEFQAVYRPYNDSLQQLVIHYKIPKQKLKFVMEDSLFYSRYEIQLTVFDNERNQLTGDYWRVKKSEDTLDIQDSIRLLIPPMSDYYNLRLLDLYGTEIFNTTEKIILIRYLGNIQWFLTEDTLKLNFTVFNQRGEVDNILTSIGEIKKEVALKQGVYNDSILFFVRGLKIDKYKLKLEMFSNGVKVHEIAIPVKISRPFYMDDNVWYLKIDQLEYIATPSEMNALRAAKRSERDSSWHAFWEQYDPTPNTEYNEKEAEYFERIKYAEEHFSHGDKGWRSDRARIYVKYGQPDEIISRPYELDYYPIEVWYYYRFNIKYIFVDRYGLGQYILMNPRGSSI